MTDATLAPMHIPEFVRLIRGQRVMLDADLAALYGVATRTLTQAIRRNPERFPPDFMFQLSEVEFDRLRSQNGISKRGGRRYRPLAFTEQGVAMLSSVLRSEQAVRVNIEIMRTFVQLRRTLSGHDDLVRRLDELEERYDERFRSIFEAIREMMAPPAPPRRQLGFAAKSPLPPEE